MVTVIFYEKPGCINNTRQKTLLSAAGHQVQAHNLLTEKWTDDRLRQFFGDRPVDQWFNRSAPQVKSGEVLPEELDVETALALMVKSPLLIRRPLMQVGDRFAVGFDVEKIDQWIGLQSPDQAQTLEDIASQDLQNCPRQRNDHGNDNNHSRTTCN